MKGHVCVDCKALAEAGFQGVPKTPRPAPHGGPRSKRCTTHHRARKRAEKLKRSENWVLKTKGLTPEEYDELLAFQGGTCAIPGCRANGTAQRLTVDHDHELAAQHDHAVEHACRDCVRGLVCRPHNYDLLGKYAPDLQAGLDYLAFPPMARLAHLKESA